MTRIIMHGCNGAMGRVISELLAGNTDTKIVAGVDLQGEKLFDYPVFTSLESIDVEADAIIDLPQQRQSMDCLIMWRQKRSRLYCARQVFLMSN